MHGLPLTSRDAPSADLQSPWPTSNNHAQSGRPKVLQLRMLLVSYQLTGQAMGLQASGQAFCQNWYRSLKGTPLSLPPTNQGLGG